MGRTMGDKEQDLFCKSRDQYPQYPYPGPDKWDTHRWEKTWPEQFNPHPRTCSFCGSIDPDDAIRLIKAGWEIGDTGKNYKWYLEVPGTAFYRRNFINSIGNEEHKEALDQSEYQHLKGPPVKLYSWHISPEQAEELRRKGDDDETD